MLDKKKSHWDNVYTSKSSSDVNWYQPHLETSLELIKKTGIKKTDSIIDIGGGAATLVDDLLRQGYQELIVLDISSEALRYSQKRLGNESTRVGWIESNILEIDFPENKFNLWHDRAVFHFLTSEYEIQTYVRILKKALKPSGIFIIGSFNLEGGPFKCSGLDVMRYSPQTLSHQLGTDFSLIQSLEENHQTPFGTTQKFVYCVFRKKAKTMPKAVL